MKYLPLVLLLLGQPVLAYENLVIVIADDLGSTALNHYSARTPSLDEIATQGVSFTDTHSAAAICNASRGALLTGVPPHVSKMWGNHGGKYFRTFPALANATTLPQHLRNNGFRTASFSKVIHGGPEPQSFDVQGDTRGGSEKKGKTVYRGKSGLRASASMVDYADSKTAAGADDCISFINETHTQPFAAFCATRLPHLPHFSPQEFWDAIPDPVIEPAGYIPGDRSDTYGRLGTRAVAVNQDRASGKQPNLVKGYLAAMAMSDRAIGDIYNGLMGSPYASNTLFVVIGDHGFCLGEKDHARKSVLWRCGTQTPMIFAGAGITAGEVDHVASLMDLQPTILELLGLPSRTDIAGQSLAHLIDDPTAPHTGKALITTSGRNHALRTDDATLIQYKRYKPGSTNQTELYLRSDQHEVDNLANNPDYADLLESMRAELNAALE